MGLGVLQDNKLPHVPGTVILSELEAHSEDVTGNLRHGTGRRSHIILAPQPSEDPNDPLNWSSLKKLAIILIVCYGACINACTISSLLNAGAGVIALQFNVEISAIILISGYQLLVVGASGPIVSALSRKVGKRPVFLFATAFGLLGTIIGAATDTYNGLLAARIVQGLAISAYESVLVAVIGDLFFVHERGFYMTITQFVLGTVSNFPSIITGPITTYLGWKYLFYILIAFSSSHLILTYFFVPETTYHRDVRYETDELAVDNLEELAKMEYRHTEDLSHGAAKNSQSPPDLEKTNTTTSSTSPVSNVPAKKTFWQEKAIFSGTHSNENFLQLLVAPVAVCFNLAVLWVVVITGVYTALFVAVAIDLAEIFFFPPYGLSAAGIGYLSLGPFVGGLLASIVMALVSDPLIVWCTRRNGGVYEPEFRILPTVLGVFCGAGLMAFGAAAQAGRSYYLTAFFHGMSLFGIMFLAIPAASYAIDAYRDMSNEIFIAGMMFKNFLFYGFSYFINDWTVAAGPRHVFYVLGAVAFALMVTCPLVYVFGKRYRSYWHRHNLLKTLKIRTHAEI